MLRQMWLLFYSTFIKGKTLKTNSKTAELCKLMKIVIGILILRLQMSYP